MNSTDHIYACFTNHRDTFKLLCESVNLHITFDQIYFLLRFITFYLPFYSTFTPFFLIFLVTI